MERRHGGNLKALARQSGRDQESILDFSASINPLGPPECLRAVVSRALEQVLHYPDPDCTELTAALAARHALPPERIVCGNGSSELFVAIFRALSPRRVVIPVPTYGEYAQAAAAAGHEIVTLCLSEASEFAIDWQRLEDALDGEAVTVLGRPNNPTGQTFDPAALRELMARRPAATFVIDEAFVDFLGDDASLSAEADDRLIVVRSLTKFYAMPGMRLGFAATSPEMAAAIRRQVPPWSVGTLAQVAGAAVLQDDAYAAASLREIPQLRSSLAAALGQLPGIRCFPSEANYLLVRLNGGSLGAAALAGQLLERGIAIRTFAQSEHLDDRFFRVAVRSAAENERLVAAIAEILGARPCQSRRRKTPALMIQGTSSNAGKSVLVAALGRILFQDGVRVAPFKAQNMSLNSFVTDDGREMGRAQVVQAQACRLAPDVRMNPILLKPSSDTGSQVIVEGHPVGNMNVGEYVRYKPEAFAAAQRCYDSLAGEFDAMLLEGAGSPGEVNLKGHDIVNMRMAQYADAPVLVVGDIDRGGVFASFVGTMEVLAPWERRLVAGWIVNRFRGDASLLQPALDYTQAHTGRPVVGVVPYLPQIDLPQEDSVEFKSGALDATDEGGEVEIAVVDLPHISNFTDFDALRGERDVRLRVVRSAEELGRPDAVILPGSKNTLGDLEYLRTSGLGRRVAALASEGAAEVVGICGGFQMLGMAIDDPHQIESGDGAAQGLALLQVRTVLAAEKTLCRAAATHQPSGLRVSGYEIHHGVTAMDGMATAFLRGDGVSVGAATRDGRVWGTYLHGVFDADAFRRWFIDRLRVRRGLMPKATIDYRYDIEPSLERLAAAVRQSVDMAAIYGLLRL